MNKLSILFMIAILSLTLHCSSDGGYQGDSGASADGDSDTDADGDSDVDGDVDGDTDGDSDIDASPPQPNPDAFFALDPPPQYCGPDGEPQDPVEVPGGTPECPDDKNREGCPCTDVGEEAICWPGLRANRNRGICRDGVTECMPFDEFYGAWGPCEGYVLPVEGVELGPEACMCFSEGRWVIDNLSPCFVSYDSQSWAVSTYMLEDGSSDCPTNVAPPPPFQPQPDSYWSTNRLNVDCAGQFELCYTLRAGDAENPQATDCVVARACTSAWYEEANVLQELPPLPSWSGEDPACATAFAASGGYGEMSVLGRSIECDDISNDGEHYVFNRVSYCALDCNERPEDPDCVNCMQGGSGVF